MVKEVAKGPVGQGLAPTNSTIVMEEITKPMVAKQQAGLVQIEDQPISPPSMGPSSPLA